MTKNEAAERLRRRIKEAAFPMWPMAHVELREALDTRQRLTVERVHWANQWRDGGDHPNTPDIDDCGSCAYLLATADVDEEEPQP